MCVKWVERTIQQDGHHCRLADLDCCSNQHISSYDAKVSLVTATDNKVSQSGRGFTKSSLILGVDFRFSPCGAAHWRVGPGDRR